MQSSAQHNTTQHNKIQHDTEQARCLSHQMKSDKNIGAVARQQRDKLNDPKLDALVLMILELQNGTEQLK